MNKCLMASWNRAHFQAGRQSVAQVGRVGGGLPGEDLLKESLVCGETTGLE